MTHHASIVRRALIAAAAFLAMTAALGFAQSAPGSPSTANPGHPSEPGILVISVQPGSPAEKAGISRGDIILEVNGTAVNTPRDISQTITSKAHGDTVTLKVRHGDVEKTATVTIGEMNGHPYVGVALLPDFRELREMRPQDRGAVSQAFQGALVARVTAGGPAAKAGLKRGDLILSVDGTTVDAEHSLGSLIQGKKVGDTVTLSVEPVRAPAGTTPHDVKVTLGAAPDGKTPMLGVSYAMGSPLAELEVPRMMTPDRSVPGMMAPRQPSPSI